MVSPDRRMETCASDAETPEEDGQRRRRGLADRRMETSPGLPFQLPAGRSCRRRGVADRRMETLVSCPIRGLTKRRSPTGEWKPVEQAGVLGSEAQRSPTQSRRQAIEDKSELSAHFGNMAVGRRCLPVCDARAGKC